MSITQPTLEDVWQLFRETDRRFQETERLMKERAEEMDRQLKERFEETDRRLEKRSKEIDRKIEQMSTDIGKLGHRLGDFIEGMVNPAAVRLFQERGIDVHEVHQNIKVKRDQEGLEIDLLVVNDQDVVVLECKSDLSIKDVNEHLELLEKVKRLMPKYADSRILGAVAAMVMSDEVAKYSYRKGLYVICQSGDHLMIRNDDKFKPRVW